MKFNKVLLMVLAISNFAKADFYVKFTGPVAEEFLKNLKEDSPITLKYFNKLWAMGDIKPLLVYKNSLKVDEVIPVKPKDQRGLDVLGFAMIRDKAAEDDKFIFLRDAKDNHLYVFELVRDLDWGLSNWTIIQETPYLSSGSLNTAKSEAEPKK